MKRLVVIISSITAVGLAVKNMGWKLFWYADDILIRVHMDITTFLDLVLATIAKSSKAVAGNHQESQLFSEPPYVIFCRYTPLEFSFMDTVILLRVSYSGESTRGIKKCLPMERGDTIKGSPTKGSPFP